MSKKTKAPLPVATFPSPQTILHTVLRDNLENSLLKKAQTSLQPELGRRDAPAIARIQSAPTVEAALALLPDTKGLGEQVWYEKMHSFGPNAAPLVAQRLKTLAALPPAERSLAAERLICALRWYGLIGAENLWPCFEALDDYGRSLASLVLGVLRFRRAADAIAAFYQTVKNQADPYFVGALWGLLDLQDPRAAAALAELYLEGKNFYELYGFLALAGDRRVIMPLIVELKKLRGAAYEDARLAIVAIAHRLGRAALLEESAAVANDSNGDTTAIRTQLIDRILQWPLEEVQEHFEIFYNQPRHFPRRAAPQ